MSQIIDFITDSANGGKPIFAHALGFGSYKRAPTPHVYSEALHE